jgi:cell division protein FtsI/penicillin-binding protein 2
MNKRIAHNRDENRNQRLWQYVYCVSFVILTLFVRLIFVQLVDRNGYAADADDTITRTVVLPAERGRIMDRNLEPLAYNFSVYNIIADPKIVEKPQSLAMNVGRILGERPETILNALGKGGRYVPLANGVSFNVQKKIRSLNFIGISYERVCKRQYPKEMLASNLIGFLMDDGTGASGLEHRFDSILAGIAGEELLLEIRTAQAFHRSEFPQKLPENGKDLVLTIDWRYQYIAETELCKAVTASGAESGTVIVMNPKNGDILALACMPHYDANRGSEYPSSTYRINSIMDQYDPGSTVKFIHLAGLFNEQLRSPDDMVYCHHGSLKISGMDIKDSHPYDWLTVRDVLVHSSNIGMAKIMSEIDRETIYNYLKAFGFGDATGVELPAEEHGNLEPYYEWGRGKQLALAYGYAMDVTALQMTCAFCTVANGGYLVRPSIIKEFRADDKRIVNRRQNLVRQVLKPSTVDILKDIMHEVVTRGTGTNADIAGINVCGKTGTSQILRDDGSGYDSNRHIASFGGWFPMEDPKICMYIAIKDPKNKYYGGDIAAPVFAEIGNGLIQLEGRDYFLSGNNEISDALTCRNHLRQVPNLVGWSKKAAQRWLHLRHMEMSAMGDGPIIVAQQPAAGTILEENQEIEVVTERTERKLEGIVVPQVIGLPLRRALNVLSARNIQAVVDGSGRVVRQQPLPGQRLGRNEQVLLHCESSIDVGHLLAL